MPPANDEVATPRLNLPQRINGSRAAGFGSPRVETVIEQAHCGVVTYHEGRAWQHARLACERRLARQNDDIADLLELSDAFAHFSFCDRRFLNVGNRELETERPNSRTIHALRTDFQQASVRPVQWPKRSRQHNRTFGYGIAPTRGVHVGGGIRHARQHVLKYRQRQAAQIRAS